jgi:hypothetical protein
VDDFNRLIEAAKRGDEEDVISLLQRNSELINERDEVGATALHYAAFGGHRKVAKLLVDRGAYINARDGQFGATPAGWAIEYLRELGGFLAIQIDDFAHAITHSDVEWVRRYLQRFPSLRRATDFEGKPFSQLAQHAGDPEIAKLFEPDSDV